MKLRGWAALLLFVGVSTWAQNANGPIDPGQPTSGSTGSFSGVVSAAGFDGGVGRFSGVGVSGTLDVSGASTLGSPISAPGFDGGTGSFSAISVSGTESVSGVSSHGSVISAPAFDGGWVAGTTGSFTGDVSGAGAATFGAGIASDTATGNVALAAKAGALFCGDRPGCSATFTYDGGTWSMGGNLQLPMDLRVGNVVLDGGARVCMTGTGACTTNYIAGDQAGSINVVGSFLGTGNWGTAGDVAGAYLKPASGLKNTGTGASCTGTGSVCVDDTGGLEISNGSGTTVAVLSAAGLVSGDTGISSGAWHARWDGVAPESTNGQGAYYATQVGRGSKFRQVACTCRVAGSGGTTGIILSLMEDAVEVATVEVGGGDSNACDDAAGTVLIGDFNYTFAAAKKYTLQVKSTTDCAGNPTDCDCGVDETR